MSDNLEAPDSRQFGRRERRITVGVIGGATLILLVLRAVFGSSAIDAAQAREAFPTFSSGAIDLVVDPVRAQISAGAFPGASVAIGVGGGEVHEVGMGYTGWGKNAAAVDPRHTVYDLASLTKLVATASAVMLLVEEGRMWLDDPIWVYIPEFKAGAKAQITIRHLLTHTSGLPAGAILRGDSREERIARAARSSIYPPAGAREEYSDIGFVLLGEAAERAAGEPLPDYLQRKLFQPLGMTSTRFSPGLDCEACAPTSRLRDQSLYRGKPFDPIAQRLDGISGNAGLFSTAHDVGRFVAMMLNEGELDGVRILKPETVREFTSPQPFGSRYRLGWEVFCDMPVNMPEPEDAAAEPCASPAAIGHTGWTGTSLWIDPETRTWVVLLTNRTYEPRAPNRIQEVRREVFSRARFHVATKGVNEPAPASAD